MVTNTKIFTGHPESIFAPKTKIESAILTKQIRLSYDQGTGFKLRSSSSDDAETVAIQNLYFAPGLYKIRAKINWTGSTSLPGSGSNTFDFFGILTQSKIDLGTSLINSASGILAKLSSTTAVTVSNGAIFGDGSYNTSVFPTALNKSKTGTQTALTNDKVYTVEFQFVKTVTEKLTSLTGDVPGIRLYDINYNGYFRINDLKIPFSMYGGEHIDRLANTYFVLGSESTGLSVPLDRYSIESVTTTFTPDFSVDSIAFGEDISVGDPI